MPLITRWLDFVRQANLPVPVLPDLPAFAQPLARLSVRTDPRMPLPDHNLSSPFGRLNMSFCSAVFAPEASPPATSQRELKDVVLVMVKPQKRGGS